MSITTLFSLAKLPDLANPNFAVPLIPASVHDDLPSRCEVCEVVHMAPDSFRTPAERQRAADMVSAIVGAGDARRAAIASKPAGYWDSIDPRTLGADARRVWDDAFGAGEYVAARGKHRLPPAHFDAMERAAFARGFRAEESRMANAFADDLDDSHSPEEYAEVGMAAPHAGWRD